VFPNFWIVLQMWHFKIKTIVGGGI
jgi:hypothetical protein